VGFIQFGVYFASTSESGGVFGKDGRVEDAFLFGIFLAITATTTSHIHTAINIRSWNYIYTAAFVFSIVWLPLVLYF